MSRQSHSDELDDFDLKILAILAEDGRVSWNELAERIGLSQTPTLRRVRALETSGYIAGYHASIDERRVGRSISVYISVRLTTQTDESLAVFESRVAKMPEVMSCFMMTGPFDYVLRAVVADLDEYQRFVSSLTQIPGVSRITSGFAVKRVVQRTAPPLPPRSKARRPSL